MKKRTLAFTTAALFSLSPVAALAQGAAPAPSVAPAPAPAAPPAAAPAAAPAPAPAPATEAGAHFRRGVDLYNDADYTAALIEFRRAYELDPRYQALYNIGETQYQLQDYALALKTFEKYLHDGGAQIAPARRDEVQKSVEKLRTRVATVEVSTNYPGVEIAVDDVSVGKTPLAEPLLVSAGRRKLTATRPGKEPVTQIVELAGGDRKKLAMVVPDDGPIEATSVKVPPVPWAITGVLAGAAVVTGAVALDASNAVKNDVTTPGINPSQLTSDHNKTVAVAATTDVLIGCAVVAAGVSIYFTVASGKRSKDDKGAPAAAAGHHADPGPRVALTSPFAPGRFLSGSEGTASFVRLQAGPQSVLLSGTF